MNQLLVGLADASSGVVHPLSVKNQEVKHAYLLVLSSMIKIDGLITPQEIFRFKQIAKEIKYSGLELLEKEFLLTTNINYKKTEEAFKCLFDEEIADAVVLDLLVLALVDEDFHANEERFLANVADFFQINANKIARYKDFVLEGFREKPLKSAAYYREKFAESGLDYEKFRFWYSDEAIQENSASNGNSFKPDNVIIEGEQDIPTGLENEKKSALVDRLSKILQRFSHLVKNLPQNLVEKLPSPLEKHLESIALQQARVVELRLYMAFVGTMSSGKSTAINAIVGEELLPASNEAMTVVPTIITHSRGFKIPLMKFAKAQIFNHYAGLMSQSLHSEILKECENETFHEILQSIFEQKYEPIPESCEGLDAIRKELERLNHLARAFIYLNLESNPVNELQNLKDFPEILIEFAHADQFIGKYTEKLSIVDTPGPNEAKNGDNLRVAVKRTLEKVDAIICVVDPNQLDAGAQKELADWIVNSVSQNRSQFFAFLNKIDLFNAKEKKEYLEKTSLEHKLAKVFPEEIIPESGYYFSLKNKCFPISSRFGLLAQQAQIGLRSGESADKLLNEDWFVDFSSMALGAAKDSEEIELSELQDACNKLLVRSNILPSMEKVFRYCLIRTFPEATNQTKDVLRGSTADLSNFLQLERQSVEHGLSRAIEIKGIIEEKLSFLAGFLKGLEEAGSDNFDKMSNILDAALVGFENELKNGLEEVIKRQKKEFSCHHRLEFEDKGLAKAFAENIFSNSKKCFENLIIDRLNRANEQIRATTQEISERIERELLPHLKELETKMQKEFCFQLNFPDFKPYELKMDFELAGCASYTIVSESTTIRERSWWTLNLVAEDKKVDREYFVFNENDIFQKIYKKLSERFAEVSDNLKNFLKSEVEKVFEFCKLAQEEVKQSLLALDYAIKNYDSDQRNSESSKQNLDSYLEKLKEIEKETESLDSGIAECRMLFKNSENRSLLIEGKELQENHKLRELFFNLNFHEPEFEEVIREIDDYFNENSFLILANFSNCEAFSRLHKAVVDYEGKTNKTIILVRDLERGS